MRNKVFDDVYMDQSFYAIAVLKVSLVNDKLVQIVAIWNGSHYSRP